MFGYKLCFGRAHYAITPIHPSLCLWTPFHHQRMHAYSNFFLLRFLTALELCIGSHLFFSVFVHFCSLHFCSSAFLRSICRHSDTLIRLSNAFSSAFFFSGHFSGGNSVRREVRRRWQWSITISEHGVGVFGNLGNRCGGFVSSISFRCIPRCFYSGKYLPLFTEIQRPLVQMAFKFFKNGVPIHSYSVKWLPSVLWLHLLFTVKNLW